MSFGDSGGTQTTPVSKINTNAPWTALQPYINEGYKEVSRLYSEGPQKYTPWSQVTELTPEQKSAMSDVSSYVNSPELQQAMQGGQDIVSGLMSGRSNPYSNVLNPMKSNVSGYLGNNNLYDPSQGINRMMYQNTQDPNLTMNIARGNTATNPMYSQLRGQLQNPSLSGGIADRSRAMNTASQTTDMLGRAYDFQNQNRIKASQLANTINQNKYNLSSGLLNTANTYGINAANLGIGNANQMANMPIAMLQSLNQMGQMQQVQNQAQLTDATNRWNFEQNAPYANLTRYRNLINPNPSWGTTSQTGTQTTTTPSNGGGLGQMLGTLGGAAAGFFLGGGPQGAMLGASLGGSLGGGIGSQFH